MPDLIYLLAILTLVAALAYGAYNYFKAKEAKAKKKDAALAHVDQEPTEDKATEDPRAGV